MKKGHLLLPILLTASLFYFSCKKEVTQSNGRQEEVASASNAKAEVPTFNLEVILRGEGNAFGLVKFRQDVDPSKIITLDT